VIRPSATPTITPTRIPTTVSITSLKPPARLIAFERDNQIWTITTDGKTARQVTKDGRNYRPVWAPDGKTLAFLSNRDDPRYRIYFMDPDGSNIREVSGPVTAASSGNQPDLFGLDYAFSPNGKRLVYIAQLEPYVSAQLMLLDLGSSDLRPLTAPEGAIPPDPAPRPAQATETVAPAPVEGTPAETAIPTPSATPTPPPPPPVIAQQVAQPAWASDNRTVVYVDNSNLEQDVIYLLDVDTGKRTLLVEQNAVNRSPIFSADGKSVLFTSSEGASMMALKSELYSVRRDGKGRAKLAPGFTAAPGWGALRLSPNGSKLVADWSARLGGFGDPWTNEITVMSAAGKTPVDLTAAYPRPYYGGDSPTWAPDSRFLAFHLYYCPDPECKQGTNQIVVADTAAKKVTLAVLTTGNAPAWQP
jgi:Tol biopolymer transport system component